jgi:hypothetical protein
MSEQPIQDINDGKPWSEMDLFDLRNSLAYGRSIEEVAVSSVGPAQSRKSSLRPKNWGCYGNALLLGPLRLGKTHPRSAVPQQAGRLASLRRGLR